MSLLSKVTEGVVRKPLCVLIHGKQGLGKSSFALDADRPIFVGAEAGSDHLRVKRYPLITTWEMMLTALDELANEKHDYGTLVLDTADSLEPLLHDKIKKDSKVSSIELAGGGYGKGYIVASEQFMILRDKLDVLRKKGMNIIVVAHSEPVDFPDPVTGISYKKWQIKLHKKALPVFLDWADNVLFISEKIFTVENSQGKEIAIGEGERVFYTEERPSFQAKNRFSLPFEIPYKKGQGWTTVKKLIDEFYDTHSISDQEILVLKNEIEAKIKKLPKELYEKATSSFKDAKEDIQKLTEINKRLNQILGGN